jgi:hypothetical protein
MKNEILLPIAAEHGHTNIVKTLILNGSDPNEKRLGDSALCLAVKAGHKEVVQALLDLGADVTMKDSEYKSPTELANERDDKEIWSMISERETEGKLAESPQRSDEEIDLLFDARVCCFSRKPGSKVCHPKIEIRSVWDLLRDSKPSQVTQSSAFRWIHLPANNVSLEYSVAVGKDLTHIRCNGLRYVCSRYTHSWIHT